MLCKVGWPRVLPPGAPTDPDVQVSRIRLLRPWDSLRDAERLGPLVTDFDEGIR